VSTDNGETTFKTKDQVILGMFFFMNDFKFEHSRSVYNIQTLLSNTGGVATSILFIFGILGAFYNSYVYMAFYINLLYFVKAPQNVD